MSVHSSLLLNRWVELDQGLFRQINQQWTSAWLDRLAPWMRESTHWIPLYIALLVFALWRFRKQSWIWILFGVVTVVASDLIGNYGFKHVFERLRPCQDPNLQHGLRLLVDRCGTGFSFVSNHATNHMSLAVFLFITLRNYWGLWGWIAIGWALSIGYAQVYVGLHFPADVVAGSLLGAGIGGALGWSFNRQFKSSIFPENQSRN